MGGSAVGASYAPTDADFSWPAMWDPGVTKADRLHKLAGLAELWCGVALGGWAACWTMGGPSMHCTLYAGWLVFVIYCPGAII